MSKTPPRPTTVSGSGTSDLPPRGSASPDRGPGVRSVRPPAARLRLVRPRPQGRGRPTPRHKVPPRPTPSTGVGLTGGPRTDIPLRCGPGGQGNDPVGPPCRPRHKCAAGLTGRRMITLLTQPAASTHARPHCTSYSAGGFLPFAAGYSWPAPTGAEGRLARPRAPRALGPRALGSKDVTPSLHKPSSGRWHPPSLPKDTVVTTKHLHHNPTPTDTEEAICRARRQLAHGRPPPPACTPALVRGWRRRRTPRNLVSPFLFT
uniref:Uncharacterized protein n=1 Tax=Setaria viridis TaxID=4556 RepID=A0A4U6UTS8_SETVI|nr:hypothetical protein SEVIR_5G442700v2 [Setaria viridis]